MYKFLGRGQGRGFSAPFLFGKKGGAEKFFPRQKGFGPGKPVAFSPPKGYNKTTNGTLLNLSKGGVCFMKIVVIGAVAAGTKAAAKLKRCDRSAEVKILTKSKDISYAGCGLPYYISGAIPNKEQLIVNTPEKFAGLTGAQVVCGAEVTAIDPQSKTVTVQQGEERYQESYDKLIIASGAVPFVPKMEGTDLPGVYSVRTPDDVISARSYIQEKNVRRAVVCGAGFIGLEVAENLQALGLDVTVLDAMDQILPNAFDREMADYVKKQLRQAGIKVLTSTSITAVEGEGAVSAVLTNNGRLPCELAVLAIGIRPATAFAQNIGLEMDRGAIVVDEYMQTNLPDIYAAGDCALVKNALTGARQWSAMGSTANLSARALAMTVGGQKTGYKGCLGTGVAKLLPKLNVGRTGLGQEQAAAAGIDAESVVVCCDDKAHYYPGASTMILKLTAERSSGRILGLQAIGAGAVDKMVDVVVCALLCGAKLSDLDCGDFAYAPPFSTAIHPVVNACYVLENKLAGRLESLSPAEYAAGKASDYTVLDVHPVPTVANAPWVDLAKVNGPLEGFDKDAKLLLVCNRGKRAYFLQNRLKALGYTNTRVLEGGSTFTTVKVARQSSKLPPEEIKRVKGLGCLQDKRYDDVFNVRVITRNGKITTDEQRAIAEAADKFGSGEVTMTTRLTLEIQGVPYDNLEALFSFLADHGISTGGTGSKVRPVVSCKGTTCQYGLIDTFALSEKLHKLFYEGYHNVSLPHKFKIAVGGCPNNCVKPNLNDLGIIGQRIPSVDLAKCRGCKVCQVENTCPIKIAKVVDGKVVIDPSQCNHCGRCIGKCPFGVIDEEATGYKVYVGGRWGKKVAQGRELSKIFTSEEEVIDLVEKAILFFRDEGISGERFADTINRLGMDYVEDKLLHATIDKEKIMEKNVVGGATC